MEKCRGTDIPLHPPVNLQPDVSTDRHDLSLKYQELVGALLFISRCTRPDITFAVSKLSRYFQCYKEKHMKAAKEILRYLGVTSKLGISYKRNVAINLTGYSDADYAGDKSRGRRLESSIR